MKEQLDRLRELQELDLELDTLNNDKRDITDRLDRNRDFLHKLIADLDVQRDKLNEIKGDEQFKKDNLNDLRNSLAERRKRLTNIANTKEYNAIEKEIEVHQKSIERLQEEVTYLVEEIAATHDSICDKEEKIVQLRESIAEDVHSSEKTIKSYDDSIRKLQEKEVLARNSVSKRVMYKYDFIRKRRPGQAIIGAKDGHCEGCFMALPPQDFIEIQRGEKLITCPSCQRILYFVPSDPNPSMMSHLEEE